MLETRVGVGYLDLALRVGAFRERPSKRVEQPEGRGRAGSRILWSLKVLTDPRLSPGYLAIFVCWSCLTDASRGQQEASAPGARLHRTPLLEKGGCAQSRIPKQIWLLLFWIQLEAESSSREGSRITHFGGGFRFSHSFVCLYIQLYWLCMWLLGLPW